ncbi:MULTISPECIES: sulfite exporter TauE/SafE family protein [unclassified Haladaptatus]|uniref:sulfite exporter TauE/SafE family protein n=1 Tax=unclassified Haladaptatus TaxID=2622732 RepID=UPI00209C3DC2|nr:MULTISPECIES: sulfite exporter TauE/SafE family protein [unclassified Haladaptatus]MCO8245835.1 sulfite exporter TauE/SafE family protein [Haladaptatus sp. AB643]MCO8256182.1 sulfite exporter TauE/SafE family protein [Haladaptatus sp. AB618]
MLPEPTTLTILVVIAFLSGVGITAVGPGGIFITVALFALTDVSSSVVAGTAMTTFVFTGLLGTFTYVRSGELRSRSGRRLAVLVTVPSIVGAVLGAFANTILAAGSFGTMLTAFTALVGVTIVYRERHGLGSKWSFDHDSTVGIAVFGGLGLGIGVVGGLLGVGGPVIAVPVLIVLGVSMLDALAAAQVQSVFLSAFAAMTYLTQGAVSVPLAVAVGVPELLGVVVGWRVAHRVEPSRLKLALGASLVATGFALALF